MEKRLTSGIKELYRQVGEYEYDRLNPYAEMRSNILSRYPNASIKGTRTEIIVVYGVQAPMLTMYYELPAEVTTPLN